nr:MAG TPA: hypothetical protein [Caudoviricetes sp.]
MTLYDYYSPLIILCQFIFLNIFIFCLTLCD